VQAARQYVRVAAFAALGLVGACSRPVSPETEVRATLARAEQAVAAKDLAVLRELIAEQYRDGEGHDRRAIEQMLRVYFLRHGSIHLLTRVKAVRFPAATQAEVVALVAMAGTPIASGADLSGLAADLYRFELVLVREGGAWRAVRAAWQRAEPGELL
jgi:hypothetical protein